QGERVGDGAAEGSDTFTIAASSGSTGAPKFVAVSHLQYFFLASGVLEALALSGPHRFLCTLPLCYVSAPNRWVSHLLRGDCVVIYPNLFTAAEYVDLAQRVRATIGVLVPTIVRQLLANGGASPSLRKMILSSTGAPLSADEKR